MRTHSLRSFKTFVRDECGVYHTVYVCVWGGVLLVPSCCLIHPGSNSKQLDQQTILAYFFLMLWWLSGYGDFSEKLCSLCDTHAAHALIDISAQLRCGIFSFMRKFLPFSQKGGNISSFIYLSWQCDPFNGGWGWGVSTL